MFAKRLIVALGKLFILSQEIEIEASVNFHGIKLVPLYYAVFAARLLRILRRKAVIRFTADKDTKNRVITAINLKIFFIFPP
jgi:hypothetical protein